MASPSFDAKGSIQSYADLSQLLTQMGRAVDGISLDDVKVLLRNDQLMPVLKKMVHARGMNRVRMTANTFDGTYVDDMMLYRNE